jgi:hypothetical protein
VPASVHIDSVASIKNDADVAVGAYKSSLDNAFDLSHGYIDYDRPNSVNEKSANAAVGFNVGPAGPNESSLDNSVGTQSFEISDESSSVNAALENATVADEKGLSNVVPLDCKASIKNEVVAPFTGFKSCNESEAGYGCSELASSQSCLEIGHSLSQANTDIAESDVLVEGSKEHDIEHHGSVLFHVSSTKINHVGASYDGFLTRFQALGLEDGQGLALKCAKRSSPDELKLLAQRSDTANGQEQVVSQRCAQDSSDRTRPGTADESFFVMDQTLALQDEVALHRGAIGLFILHRRC